jgi:chemotaxis protein MotB
MRRTGFFTAALIAFALAATGCVPKEEYDAKVKEADDLKAQLADAEAKYADRIKQLEDENADLLAKADEGCDTSVDQELLEELKKKEEQAKKRLEMVSDLLKKLKSLIEAKKLKVTIRNGKMLLELPEAVLFKSGSAQLSEDGKATLLEVAPVLADIKGREFQVAGHTDNQPIKKSEFKSNWQLSTERALTVVEFLQQNGVKPTNLSAAGYSEYQPVSKSAKAANRRIEIVIVPDLDELPSLDEIEELLKAE